MVGFWSQRKFSAEENLLGTYVSDGKKNCFGGTFVVVIVLLGGIFVLVIVLWEGIFVLVAPKHEQDRMIELTPSSLSRENPFFHDRP